MFNFNLEVLCLKDEKDPKFGKFVPGVAANPCETKVTYNGLEGCKIYSVPL